MDYNYYMGLNYTTSTNNDTPTMVDKNLYTDRLELRIPTMKEQHRLWEIFYNYIKENEKEIWESVWNNLTDVRDIPYGKN